MTMVGRPKRPGRSPLKSNLLLLSSHTALVTSPHKAVILYIRPIELKYLMRTLHARRKAGFSPAFVSSNCYIPSSQGVDWCAPSHKSPTGLQPCITDHAV